MKTPVDNIKNLSYLKVREQIVISISYKIFEDKFTQYNERKRAYLTQSPPANGELFLQCKARIYPYIWLYAQPKMSIRTKLTT